MRFKIALDAVGCERRGFEVETQLFAHLSEGAGEAGAICAEHKGQVGLAQVLSGEIDMAAPQIMTLAHLARFADVQAALAHAATRVPPLICPESVQTPTGRMVCYPGDPRHPVSERAMPGPTALLFENNRFRPEAGFDAWFD